MVSKNLIGEIIARFERRGLKVSALKLVKSLKNKLNIIMLNMKANLSLVNWLNLLLPALLQQWLFPVRMQLKRFVARWVLLIR